MVSGLERNVVNMKMKLVSAMIVTAIVISGIQSPCVFASSEITDNVETTESEVDTAESNSFAFRDLDWWAKKNDVEEQLVADGATVANATWPEYVLRMSGINYTNTLSGSSYVDGGGFTGRYTGLKVAGYDVSDSYACYLFPIDDNGVVNKSIDDAQFYFGWYVFDSDDYVDGEGIYSDLSSKLTSLYGNGTENTEDDFFSTVTWNDESNNQIRLLLGGKNKDYKYVTLGYIAADADKRLDEMQSALDAEAANAEAMEREKNKNDVSGL